MQRQIPELNLKPFVAGSPATHVSASACHGPACAPFVNEGFIGGIGFFWGECFIGNLYLTLLFFLGIISSIVKENAYALWTEKPRKGAYETRKNAISQWV